MSATIQSIQIGSVITEGNPESRDIADRHWTTGFHKQPVPGAVRLTKLGIIGDAVADLRLHGGPNKAVLCYAADHYDAWAVDHPELQMTAGGLGENLTIKGLDESTVCIGDTFRIGDSVVQVSQPRQPCWKISRRWGVKTMTKEVAKTGRTGWYLRVITEGKIELGQSLELTEQPNPNWSVSRANDVLFGREVDRMATIELMSVKELSQSWKDDIA